MGCPDVHGTGFLLGPILLIGIGVLSYFLKRRFKRDTVQYAALFLGIGLMVPSYWFAREVLSLCGVRSIVLTYVILVGIIVACTLYRPPGRDAGSGPREPERRGE
jgi:hypothetical protein